MVLFQNGTFSFFSFLKFIVKLTLFMKTIFFVLKMILYINYTLNLYIKNFTNKLYLFSISTFFFNVEISPK